VIEPAEFAVIGSGANNGRHVHPSIAFEASPEARQVISELGRTEDLELSPSRNRLAIAAFTKSKIAVFDLDIRPSSGAPRISISNPVCFASTTLHHPHGMVFLDEDTIVVTNRHRFVDIFRLPRAGGQPDAGDISPLRTISRVGIRSLISPGSVAGHPCGSGRHRLIICDNYANQVTSLTLTPRGKYRVRWHRVLLEKNLYIPDGVSVSADCAWLAVSNHVPGTIFIYPNLRRLHRWSKPVAVLHGMDCPHGIRFSADARHILTVDAAQPFLYVFEAPDGHWRGEYHPVNAVRILDEATYLRGRSNPEEGGPKGIDLDTERNILAMTCEFQPLAFYDVRRLLK